MLARMAQAAVVPTGYRPFLSGLRSPVISPLTRFLIGVPLVFLTTMTAQFFAWTIVPPMTAAFLGANYFASALLALLAAREILWANGRIAVSVSLAFAPLTTVATLMHLDLFHLDTFFGWFWVIAYCLYPPQLIYFVSKQLKVQGTDPPRGSSLPVWVKAILGVQAVVMIPLGIAMFVAPISVGTVWPWALTALTGQVVAAWVLAFGVLAAHAIYENDFARTRPAMLGYSFLGAMQVLMLARFHDDVRWGSPGAWIYVAFLASFFVLGFFGLMTDAKTRTSAAG
jgi:hypothetical protein